MFVVEVEVSVPVEVEPVFCFYTTFVPQEARATIVNNAIIHN